MDAMIGGLREAYNSFKIEPCEFAGHPDDFAALDYIPYELPIAEQYVDGSLAFAMTWGNVLAQSFVLHGLRMTNSRTQNPMHCGTTIRAL